MKFGHFTDKGLPESDIGYRCPSWEPMPDGKKNVVILGCSHTYGVGLKDDEHWTHFLSKHNTERLRYWNLGQPGASADKIVRILYGCEKVIDPRIIIVCWPFWSRREKLHQYAESMMSYHEELKHENDDTDKNNFLKNVFFVEKFAEKTDATVFHCFAQDAYPIQGVNAYDQTTIKKCWPVWSKQKSNHKDRIRIDTPSLAKDGMHYGVEHHERFAELFYNHFRSKLK